MGLLQSKPLETPKPDEPLRIRPLRRVEYDRLVGLGVFEDERIELLRGALVEMSPQGAPHADCSAQLAKMLILRLGERASVRAHGPFAATEDSEPEPDVAVNPPRRYSDGHPQTAHLLVEVADSSLRKDRGIKSEIYAEAGVPEYWIVDVSRAAVEVWTGPVDGHYTQLTTYGRGESIALVAFPDVLLATDDFLPPAG